MRAHLIVETRRVGYEGKYFLIIPDHAAGKPRRFTVYAVPSSPSGRLRVIGRELPLGHAREVAQQAAEKARKQMSFQRRRRAKAPYESEDAA